MRLMKHMPWKLWGCMGEWRHIPCTLNFDTKSRWLLNLILQPLYLQVKTLGGHWNVAKCVSDSVLALCTKYAVESLLSYCWLSLLSQLTTVLLFVGFTGRVFGLYYKPAAAACCRILTNSHVILHTHSVSYTSSTAACCKWQCHRRICAEPKAHFKMRFCVYESLPHRRLTHKHGPHYRSSETEIYAHLRLFYNTHQSVICKAGLLWSLFTYTYYHKSSYINRHTFRLVKNMIEKCLQQF
jgi:hypothetical protein